MSEKNDSLSPKHVYEIVTVHLKTGEILHLAQNGTGLFHDLYIDGSMHNISIPPENIKMTVPYPLPYTDEEPTKTLQEFYLDIVMKQLEYKFLKACVIAGDRDQFQKTLHFYSEMNDLRVRGGVSIDDLVIHQLWDFLALLLKDFVYVPMSQKTRLLKLIEEISPDAFELYKKPRHPPEAYTC